MGNAGSSASIGGGLNITPKCPTPFVSADAFTCVMPCPEERKFVREGTNGAYKCVYAPDRQVSVTLTTVGATLFNGTTLTELQTVDPTRAREFTTEKDRFEREIAVAYGNIDKSQKITDAFRDLQAAENARDQSPEAYRVARAAYYTLVKGQGWLNEERERISRAEVEPEVQRYRDSVNALTNQTNEQKKVLDVVNGVKDKVLSLRDDFQYSVNTFQGQIAKLKDQIAYDTRKRATQSDTPAWFWVDGVLNVVLAAVLIYAAYALYKKVSARQQYGYSAAVYGGVKRSV